MTKILVIKFRSMGDSVLLSAFVEECRKHYPDSQIDLVLPDPYPSLYNHDPRVRKAFGLPISPRWKRYLALPALILKLKREKFDLVFCLNSSLSALWLAQHSGGKKIIIHDHNFASNPKFSIPIPGREKLHPTIKRDFLALDAIGHSTSPFPWLTKIYLTTDERTWAEGELKKLGHGPWLMLGLGASRETKRWPTENFGFLAAEWIKSGGQVMAVGSPAETFLLEQFSKFVPESLRSNLYLRSKFSLRELGAVLSYATYFVGNDSGPKHLAVAVGTKTLTLFGPENPFEYHPYPLDRHPYFFIERLSCRTNSAPGGEYPWCGIAACTVRGLECMTRITAVEVWDRVKMELKSV